MDIKAYGETKKAIGFAATWEAFKTRASEHYDKTREWQKAYFELMSIDNTYSVFYEMGIRDYNVSEGHYSVRIYLITKKAFEKNVSDWLEEHFYYFDSWEEDIALINGWDITDTRGNELENSYRVYEG